MSGSTRVRDEPEVGASVDAPAALEAPVRPDRPTRIELATAILVVGGAFSLLQKVAAPVLVDGAGTAGPILAASIALDVISIGCGLLVRSGRAWVVAANLSAIYAFLYFTLIPNLVALLFGGLYFVVAVAVVSARGWFDGMAAWRRAVAEARFRR